jgi:hypothetical protein
MKPIEHDGVWWDVRDPEREWVGTLRVDKHDEIVLTVTVPTEKPELFPTLHEYELILGIASNGTPITLINCFDRRTQGSLFGAPRRVEIHANAAIVGFHCKDSDPVLSSASVRLRHLKEWWGRSGIESDNSLKPPDFGARYRSSEPVLIYDNEHFRISIRSFITGSVGRYEASMEEDVAFEMSASTPRPLSEFQRLSRACGDFLSVACLTLCDVEDFSLVPPAEAGGTRRIGTFHAVPFFKKRAERSSAVAHMLFRFADIEEHAQAVFGAWFSKLDQLLDARTLYLVGIYGQGYIEHRLLALTQAAEAFHRRFYRDRYIDDADFETEVLKPLTAAIPSGIDESLKTAIAARLKFANEYSLCRRLRSLFVEHDDVLALLVPEPAGYISPIVDTRNEFTHFPVPAAEIRKPGQRPEPERVLLYNWILRLLLESCFLSALGFAKDDIVSFVHVGDVPSDVPAIS